MKKRILIFITVILFVLGLSTLFTSCLGSAKVDYSVTVLSPEETPVSGVTVSWNAKSSVAGSAVTDQSGKATASLPASTYSVTLSGIEEGLDYTSISVGSSMRNVTLTLSVMKVTYTVKVVDKAGAPAAGVTVGWSTGQTIAGTAKTGADGKAECALDYGQYFVTLSDLPAGNIYDGAKTADGKNPSVEFNLRDGAPTAYAVTVRSEGGLLFKDQAVNVYHGDMLVSSGTTNGEGVYTFFAAPGNYTVTASGIPAGYTAEVLNLTADADSGELILRSKVQSGGLEDGKRYVMGDIIHDYTFTTPYKLNGEIWQKSVSEILKDKEMLLISNWGTQCSWCVTEMPAMQEIYEQYSDRIEIVAVSNYVPRDTDAVINNYYLSNGYTFPMMRDTNNLAVRFGVSGWPTTVVVDRYGAIARIEAGAITSVEAWERLIQKYIGDDYVQTFTPGESVSDSINTEIAKPDIELSPDHYTNIANALHQTGSFPAGASVTWYGETEYEMAWPFILGKDKDVSPDKDVMYASNVGKANSIAIIYADVTVAAGKVFTFEYYADTESADVLSLLWDGKIIREIYGNSGGWQTCYLYADILSGTHTLALAYIKDSSVNKGKDTVYLRNVRFTDVSALNEPTDMLRAAAYGTPESNATVFPYYAQVALEEDGYYHVKLDSLQNKNLAGNDPSPLLLVNLLNATPWSSNYSIGQLVLGRDAETQEYLFDCTFTINGVTRDYRDDFTRYLTAASASYVTYCVPVDQFLHDMLVAFMHSVSGSSNENEWLEACYFYSHYGPGEFVGNPILGVMEETAIAITEGGYTVDLTRNMHPFPSAIYSFTPEADAVYKFESFIPDNLAAQYSAQIWLYDEQTSAINPLAYSGNTRFNRDCKNEQNFELYYYMQAGHKYYISLAFLMSTSGSFDFTVTNVGQSVTVMTSCSDDVYEMVLDEQGNMTGEIVLAGAIEYVQDQDGYFHAVNADGTMGDFIYLDVLNASTSALGTIPLSRLIDVYVTDPGDYSALDYKMFDFAYAVLYYSEIDSEGYEIVTYSPTVYIEPVDPRYTDYTEILREYISSAPTAGEYKGLIKVNQELVDILTLFFELRLNAIMNGSIEQALENEWLRFCWYNKTYSQPNA